MRFFDEKTAIDLEFDQIRSWLANFCVTETVADRLSKLQTYRDPKEVEYRLNLVHELQLIRNRGVRFPRMEFEELTREIQMLNITASVLELDGIVKILDASRFVNELFLFFKEHRTEYFALKTLLEGAHYTKDIENEIDKILDKRLNVKDNASTELQHIRQSIVTRKKQINKNFDRALKTARGKGYIDDISENVIDNRRVMTVISTFKRQIEGSILGSSKTGSLTYVEPRVNQALNFELDQLIDDERKEIRRILAELTNFMRSYVDLISSYQQILCSFDEVNAKVKLAQKINGVRPQINHKDQDSDLIEAFHPILMVKNEAVKLKTIPQSFALKNGSRLLVISGPNAGGKSITLKTMGLLQLMFQSGLLVPVSTKSKMGFFDYILSDIGDNQSIENQLSTYSYRLQRMNFFLGKTSSKTLLLLDEFGTGSDPELGGALAEVFFETIYEKGCFGVITTHYSNIKLKAAQLPEAINANMIFNRNTLVPEYQLAVGQPGSSFTFEVAQMNGIPHDMLKRAKAKVDGQKIKLDELISDLQRDKSILQKLKKESYQANQEMQASKDEFEEKSSHYEERLKTQQQLIEKNNRFLNHGKKMSQFIQNYPSKSNPKQSEHLKELKKYITIEKSKIEMTLRKLQEAEKLKQAAENQKGNKQKRVRLKPIHTEKPLLVGSRVKIVNTKQAGDVLSVDAKEATIAFGNLKAKVKLEKLIVI